MAVSVKRFLNQTNLPEELKLEAVPFLSTVGASLGYTYDPMLELISNQIQFPNINLQYSPQDDLEGYEEYQDHLLYARNKNHMTSMKRGIKENEARREVLANSSFWAQLGAGVFDPVNLIALPLGGPALTVGRAALRGAVGVGALQTGLEAIRYPVDPLATVSESALNIGFAAVTGGLITGAVSIPMVRRNNALNKTIDDAQNAQNEDIELNTLGQLDTNQLKTAQSKPARKLFNNKTSTDLRNESNLNSKTVFGYNKILDSGFFEDGNVAEGNALLNISVKRDELINGNKLIDRELAIRRLDETGSDITDKYAVAAGGWVGSLISNPMKRILGYAVPDSAKKAIVDLAGDSGFLQNLHKLGITHGPSIYQLAKIMDGEWVGAHSELMKLYGNSIKMRIKNVGGVQIKDATTRIGNKFSKQKSETSDDFFREANRKRTQGEKASNASEAEAMEVINKFFKKWEERLEEVGLIGSKKRIESLVAEGRIKRDRIINDFAKYKSPKERWVVDHNARLDNLDAEIADWEFSLTTMADEGFAPVKGEDFLPRYWDTKYITANRESFAKVLHDWYSQNPYTYEVSGNLKWKRIDLKTTDQAIAERVEKTIDNILGTSDSQEIPNVGAGKSKHLKHRVLDIPNSLVWDFMIQDPLAIMKGYTHKTAAKYQFAKKHNRKSINEVIDDEINTMHAAGTDEKIIDKWRKDYFAMYERVVTSPMQSSPDRWDNKTAYYLKEAAQLNYLGSAGISAIPDFAKIIMEHELGDVVKGLQGLLTDTRVTLEATEAKLVGEAIELIQGNSHFRIVDQITNDITNTNTYDRIKNTFYLANGLAPITQLAKSLDSIIRGHSLIDMSIKLRDGKASKLQIEYLARYNIDKELAIEIANAPYEQTANGLYLPNTKDWENNYQFPKHDAIVQYGPTNSYTKDNVYKAAFYRRSNNTIYFDRDYIQRQFLSKPWTKPKMEGVKPLPDDAFESPQSWANFVFMHEIMHNKFAPDVPKDFTSLQQTIDKINRDNDLLQKELNLTAREGETRGPPKTILERDRTPSEIRILREIDRNMLMRQLLEERLNKKSSISLKAEYENVINELALEQHNTQPRMTEETLTTFRTALQSGILNTVIMGTPADKPIIVDGVAYIPMSVAGKFGMPEHKIVKGYARVESGLLGLPFQFYSYSLGALNKITVSAAQGQMKNRAVGLSLSLGLGMLAVQLKTPKWAMENMDWDDWFARGFDQSGIAALYSDIFYTSMQTALAMGGPNITGGVIKPKFPSDDQYGAAIGLGGAGPSIGYDYLSAMKEFFIDGNYSEGAKNFTRSLPGARMWFWKSQMNELTNSFKNWF